jgi:hypothetical protein
LSALPDLEVMITLYLICVIFTRVDLSYATLYLMCDVRYRGSPRTVIFTRVDLSYATLYLMCDVVGLKLNGTHQLQAYADDVKLLGNNI